MDEVAPKHTATRRFVGVHAAVARECLHERGQPLLAVENQQTRLDTLARGCPVERSRFEADVVGAGVQEEQGTKWMTLEYRDDERAHSLLVPSVLALEVR